MKTILSYGMGVESSTLIMKWMENESLRDFDLTEDLIVITAQVGDEYPDSKTQVEQHILPRMRAHSIRYVQVARAGHLEADGIVVLDDTREPRKVYLDGAYAGCARVSAPVIEESRLPHTYPPPFHVLRLPV